MDSDVMTVTETWLKDMVTDREVTDLDTFNLYRKDRKDIRGGGPYVGKEEHMVNQAKRP